jgi:hypothetical protein
VAADVRDTRPGDRICIDGVTYDVVDRDYPPFTQPRFKITLPGDSTNSIRKLDWLEIFAPDGGVAARINVISRGGQQRASPAGPAEPTSTPS